MRFSRTPSVSDISWFLDMNANLQIDLDPPYQRKSVWTLKDRRFFLDTIFRGYPVPAIYINKEISSDGKSMYHIIDGKQRLETIFRFAANKIAIDSNFGNSDLDGKKWNQIKTNSDLAKHFWDYNIPVEYIKISDSETSINDIFDRLNRNAKTLKEQELRHAKYDGWFISFIENEADKDEWRTLKLTTKSRQTRMRDVQFFAELFMITIEGKIFGFDQSTITEYHATYDEPAENLDTGFDGTLYEEKFLECKKFILAMNDANNCITQYSRDFKDFYSLWALVSLEMHLLLSPEHASAKYKLFMDLVASVKSSMQENATAPDVPDPVMIYYTNSIGASTEDPQRTARHTALKTFFSS